MIYDPVNLLSGTDEEMTLGDDAAKSRKLFQIGFNKCGTKFLTELFDINGYRGIHWAGGALAEDIAYSKIVNRQPLKKWSDRFTVFTDMESVHRFSMPLIEGYKEYEYLDRWYPGAVFVLNTRSVTDWIISRYMHQGSYYAQFHSQHLGVDMADLADIWAADWDDHIAACRSYFSGRGEFVEINIDETKPQDYQEIFGKWFDLKKCPPLPDEAVFKQRADYMSRLPSIMEGDESAKIEDEQCELLSVEMAAYSVPERASINGEGFSICSDVFAEVDLKAGTVRDKNRELMPIRKDVSGSFLVGAYQSKIFRLSGVANDLLNVQSKGTFFLDFQDSRRIGVSPETRVGAPIMSYCRRKGAENIFLWPLPEYHSIGATGFPGEIYKDTTDFDAKIDRVVWRGALSGHCSDVISGEYRRPVHQVVNQVLAQDAGVNNSHRYIQLLRQNIRFRFVEKFISHPDFDIALTPNEAGRSALSRLGLRYLWKDFRYPSFFSRYRYILSLRGFDTGSNFLQWANSNSVVLKEEDGWELFYSYLFKPWKHYIPLEPGGVDVLEKLEWARGNEGEVINITNRAKEACRILQNADVRRRYMKKVSDAYLEVFDMCGGVNSLGQAGGSWIHDEFITASLAAIPSMENEGFTHTAIALKDILFNEMRLRDKSSDDIG